MAPFTYVKAMVFREGFTEGMALGTALRAAVNALAGPERTLTGSDLEVAHLGRSNGRHRSVPVPAGRSRVVMSYAVPGLAWGWGLSAAAALVLLFLFVGREVVAP